MTVAEALAAATSRLVAAGIPDAPRDARRLVAHAQGVSPDRLSLVRSDAFCGEGRLEDLLSQRLARRPVAQIVGYRDFYGRRFRVTSDVLDPRPETETLVDIALREDFSNVLDLGTGTGCLIVTLMAERPGVAGTGTDISAAAIAVAAENAAMHGVAPEFRQSSWFHGLGGEWDLIVSNPPYITEEEFADLAPELAWEPRIALMSGGDGLAAYREIAAGAPERLAPGGRLLVEIGATQAREVTHLFEAAGLVDVSVWPDLDGRDRVVMARRRA